MKILCSIVILVNVTVSLHAQGVDGLKGAIDDPKKKVQAIHHYPESVKDGECHFVEIVSIKVTGSDIEIIESWSNWYGGKARTTLTGKITDNVATGQWESTYSEGNWSYDFLQNTGKWNKTSSISFDKFEKWEVLEFVISEDVKDGFFECK